MFRACIFVALAAVLAACDSGVRSVSTYTVRDSAGVQIIESTAPAWGDGEGWTVSEEPTLHIGVIEGADEYQFSIVTGVFERDGGIVVGDASGEVRIFGQTGTFLSAFGRQGEGPGEFRRLGWVAPFRGDSIAAWDSPGQRLSVFAGDGTFARAVSPPPLVPPTPDGTDRLVWIAGGMTGALEDGTFLGSSGTVFRGQPGQRVVGLTHLVVFSQLGDSLRSIGPFEVETRFPDVAAALRLLTPYQRAFQFTQRSGGVFILDGPNFEIEDLALDGSLERVLRASHVDLRLTDAHRQTYSDSERLRLRDDADPGALERALLEADFPETIPPASQLLVDSENHLWVRHYTTRWTVGPEHWSVFSPEGFLLGVVQTPERLQVRQIEADFLLGIWTDELDVRYIRKYGLER